jgi:hypothetical protein
MAIPGLKGVINPDGKSITYGSLVYNELGGGTYNTAGTLIGGLTDSNPVINFTTGEQVGTEKTVYEDIPFMIPDAAGVWNKQITLSPNDLRGISEMGLIGKSPTVWSYHAGDDPLGKSWDIPYKGESYVGVDPSKYSQGTLIVNSGDYPPGAPGPIMEAVIKGERAVFIGKEACQDARELVMLEGKGEFYGDVLFYMLTPRTFFIGAYNCYPCEMWCCLAGCRRKDDVTIVRIHKTYWRVWAFTTIIYDLPERNLQKYESINSNIVVVRSNYLPLPFDIAYIPPGASHIRYWSKNEIMFCEPDEEAPCPWDCGTEFKVGGDNEFYLRDEVEIPKELRKKIGEF